jgi:hypothetical protein
MAARQLIGNQRQQFRDGAHRQIVTCDNERLQVAVRFRLGDERVHAFGRELRAGIGGERLDCVAVAARHHDVADRRRHHRPPAIRFK